MIISNNIEERPPTTKDQIDCREALLAMTRDIAGKFDLEMEPFTASQGDDAERVQGIFLNTSTASGPWCIGAIVRRNNGELRIWPRNDLRGPITGSSIIEAGQIESSILEMIQQFTAA